MELNSKFSKNQSFYDVLFGFDTETTGLDKYPDTRPTDIAILKFMSDFKNDFNLEMRIRLPFGHFISPTALIIQNKFYKEINSRDNYDFYDAMAKLNAFIKVKLRHKIICGHNINNFDLKQANVWLNKALYDPYPFQEKYGHVIIDTISVAKFVKAIDENFNFPNFKLETIMKFFLGDSYKQAHGAAADVKDVFNFLQMADKKLRLFKDKSLIEILQWYSSKINRNSIFDYSLVFRPSNKGKFEPIIPLSKNTKWKNHKIIIPFDVDKIDWNDVDPTSVATQIREKASPRSMSLKKEYVYPCFVESRLTDIGKKNFSDIPVSDEFFNAVVHQLRSDKDFVQNCQSNVVQKTNSINKTILDYKGHYFDGCGFFEKDSDRMKFFHRAEPPKKEEISKSFQNEGLRKNAKLLLFNKYPEVLSPADWDCIFDEIRDEFLDDNNSSRVTYASCHEEFDQIKKDVKDGKRILSDRQRDILDDYKVRLEAFKANPKRFWEQRHGY